MSEIELIQQQLLSMRIPGEQVILGLTSMLGGIFAALIPLTMMDVGNSKYIVVGLGVLALIYGIFIMIDINITQNEIGELLAKRNQLMKDEITSMNCQELHVDIVQKLEAQYPEDEKWRLIHFDFEKDLYYHKCEVPLREEVMKLGR